MRFSALTKGHFLLWSLHRLALLLGHTFVVRPQYSFMTCDSGELWLRHNQLAAALKDEEVLRASRPLSMSGELKKKKLRNIPGKCFFCSVIWLPLCSPVFSVVPFVALLTGGLTLDQRWASALFYSLLNVCTAEGLRAKQTLQLLNELVQATIPSAAFTCQSFVNSSWAPTLNNSDE